MDRKGGGGGRQKEFQALEQGEEVPSQNYNTDGNLHKSKSWRLSILLFQCQKDSC